MAAVHTAALPMVVRVDNCLCAAAIRPFVMTMKQGNGGQIMLLENTRDKNKDDIAAMMLLDLQSTPTISSRAICSKPPMQKAMH